MLIEAIDEFNGDGHLIYSGNYIGAFVRGRTRDEALRKFPDEIAQYCRWLGVPSRDDAYEISIVQQQQSDLRICDADSDVIFDSETVSLTEKEYEALRGLALKSAGDFEALYRSVPAKDEPASPPRKTFYGMVPATAREMYLHTKNVNSYYFGEIGIPAVDEPDILACRAAAFAELEKRPDFLQNTVFEGSFGERWSLRKVCRRFVWHDRIHAKAMFRAAVRLCGETAVSNPFFFVP